MENQRRDKTPYPARMQELPAVYVNALYFRRCTYTGAKPFRKDALQQIDKYIPEPKSPWTSWKAKENWAALVDDTDFGLDVWYPGCYRF